ncbi:Protein synthesis factor, GTP-binding protein [Cordyceps fumosorosea ARSEF 2679]|uniref:Protein synthesis factor, GTP-binding protein n=1 Tax=Cordyceps fumosorosea (strain ARSEF 2679) TaxID=1081104 RepID=A0A162J5M7_CORFA|nr:Protein synthesis factor, GTP-binding protein [Cordyceps fumosorosea ARSEF 2679]OAA64072.1 Protein synthesis factor, GTP-binding protein [Cordyceps fumosorosea ARSEF 2679]
MASIFTFDPDPPKVSSPWIPPADPMKPSMSGSSQKEEDNGRHELLSDYGVTKLEAEPQEGPTEYKLHLLLRPRRAFTYMSTRIKDIKSNTGTPAIGTSGKTILSTNIVAPQTRQQRLQHLTTQLLWRMQQSSPYHAARTKELVVPHWPDGNADLNSAIQLAALIPGLEESGGALYEIGVSDDGTLVGLTEDEMDESLLTLRIMAASLGCTVEVMRMVIVGECEWMESVDLVDEGDDAVRQVSKKDKLWVAEAMVTPSFKQHDTAEFAENRWQRSNARNQQQHQSLAITSRGRSTTSQLRVTLTGPTTSGKSSLLGTLSTGTLDNGRGKSRLSLLKHRHEMASGVTSSIAQELVGYKDGTILNFSRPDIESWIDIHDQAQDGRLLFVSDSGGHPRYRRTVLRGLMNWAPHWSILCIAADDSEQTSTAYGLVGQQNNSVELPCVDLVMAHLTLSLKLDVPMAIVITKMDLASKSGLQTTLAKVLSAMKEAGRAPKILQPDQKEHRELVNIPMSDKLKVGPVIEAMKTADGLTKIVPIVLTSAMTGSGIGLVHALLESLPLPPPPTPHDFVGAVLNPEQPKSLFHIDDTYNLPISQGSSATENGTAQNGLVVSGHLRFGSLTVGERIVVGPFPYEDEDGKVSVPADRPSPSSFGLSISHPASAELARIAMKNAISASEIAGEWLKAEVVSLRNLRLPVTTLEAGQAGSIGLILDRGKDHAPRNMPRIRRGMVLAVPSKHMLDTGLSLQAASGFTAVFNELDSNTLAIGALVNVYVASIRAAARISKIQYTDLHAPGQESGNTATDELGVFNLNDEMETVAARDSEDTCATEVTLELLHTREWIEMGSRIILLEGGKKDRSGLEGNIGKVVEIVD